MPLFRHKYHVCMSAAGADEQISMTLGTLETLEPLSACHPSKRHCARRQRQSSLACLGVLGRQGVKGP